MDQQNQKEWWWEMYDGIPPDQMHELVSDPFGSDIISLKKLSDEQYRLIPIINQAKCLAHIIEGVEEIKLTQTGALPVKVVLDLYQNGGMTDEPIESGIVKLSKENDSRVVQLTRILLQLSGIIKKRNNKISLTKKGSTVISDNEKLLPLLFTTYCKRFNWGYFDGYELDTWGQVGCGFTLRLLSRYGNLKRKSTFYAAKYFDALPDLLDFPFSVEIQNQGFRAYAHRTFNYFLSDFGLVEYTDKEILEPGDVIKTKLFDAFISIEV